MGTISVEVPDELEKELPADKSAFVREAIEEQLTKSKLEKSKAFRKLLLAVFDRMSKSSTLSDEDCLRLGREVNEAVSKRYA